MSKKNTAGTALRAASAARDIAKGAAAGGLYGAAAGAVKSFLPEIVKAAVIIIAVLILLPVLIFTAIPNIVFGYDNASAGDIIELTDKAYSIDAAYKEVQNYNQEYIDGIVAASRAAYTGEDGEGFDAVEVNSVTDNTNIYWLIAITSVAYQQDLYAMDEYSIKNMTISKLTHSAQIISDTVGEGETASVLRTLKIDISDLNPNSLMDKLGFNDEQRRWAAVLYNTLYQASPESGYDRYRVPGEALSDERFAAMIEEAEKYLGYPYVWGGSSPKTSFDCSGFVCWVVNQSGVGSVGRTTAQGLYNLCTPVSRENARPGDLVFFTRTYKTSDTVTHVGIFVGESMMIHYV